MTRTLATATRERAPAPERPEPPRTLRRTPAPVPGARFGDRLQRCGGDSSCGCAPAPGALDMVQEVLRTPGSAIEPSTRETMEAHFGADFSRVRVHTDDRAAASARAVDALAYTVGDHIVFGEGGTAGGRLLAHELAHVLQQDGAGVPSGELRVEDPAAPAEREAAAAADAFQAGRASAVRERARPRVHRSPGSPAGGCGVCYGIPARAGSVAHQVIQTAFIRMYPLMQAEWPLLPAPTDLDDNGRLDLALPLMPGFAIGEIKPFNPKGLIDGEADLLWYEAQLRAVGIPTARLNLPPPPGPLIFPNPGAPGCPTQTLTIFGPFKGVYVYSCEPDFKELVRDSRCRCKSSEPEPVPVPAPVPAPRRRTEPKPMPRVLPFPMPTPMPEPLPIPVPSRREFDLIREWLRQVVESGEDALESARRFLREHPEVVDVVAGLLIGAAIVIVVVTIVEDVATLGVGIADDPASFAAAWALVRAAQELMQRAPVLTPAFR